MTTTTAGVAGSAPEPVDNEQQGLSPVRIVAEPAELRVWHNTRVRFRAVPGPDEAFERYIWHFEDGSDPARGVSVEHHFPESVSDRHVTLEAIRPDGSKLVVSRLLAIERLEVVPIDSEASVDAALPAPRGRRLVLVGESGSERLEAVLLEAAGPWKADLMVLVGSAELADRARSIVDSRLVDLPLLHLSLSRDYTAASGKRSAPISLLRDTKGRIRKLEGHSAAGVLVFEALALVVVDSRAAELDEDILAGLRADLQVASAYNACILLSARPLSPLVDNERVSDRAYRIYEHALRQKVRAVISGHSAVAYDGRFGGLTTIAVGRQATRGCARLMGTDACQPATVTVVDLPKRGRPRISHLVSPQLRRLMQRHELPLAVGKYRR